MGSPTWPERYGRLLWYLLEISVFFPSPNLGRAVIGMRLPFLVCS